MVFHHHETNEEMFAKHLEGPGSAPGLEEQDTGKELIVSQQNESQMKEWLRKHLKGEECKEGERERDTKEGKEEGKENARDTKWEMS